MKYFIRTFGCAANEVDSEKIASYYEARGYNLAKTINDADDVIINTCMVRQMAEDRVYGLVYNLSKERAKGKDLKIIVTGCMVGMAIRDKSGKLLKVLKKKIPQVDEFLAIEEVGLDLPQLRARESQAYVPISNGCNNYCTFCVVPYARGKEVSRSFDEIVKECEEVVNRGFSQITLVGQNVNSYGADIITKSSFDNTQDKNIKNPASPAKRGEQNSNLPAGRQVSNLHLRSKNNQNNKITYVKHLGRFRIPTLFPQLLEEVAIIKGLKKLGFISSNPWDFSDDLIEVIAKHKNISREIHLPVQSGDNKILKAMNRWYTRDEYMSLVGRIRSRIKDVKISTDIIAGFPGETRKQFENTVDLCERVGFSKAYLAMYSDRPLTAAHKTMTDNVSHREKKRRWRVLENLINQEKVHRLN